MAIDRAFWIALSPRADSQVRVRSLDLEVDSTFDLHSLAKAKAGDSMQQLPVMCYGLQDYPPLQLVQEENAQEFTNAVCAAYKQRSGSNASF